MQEDIRAFAEQFKFTPEIKNEEKWESAETYILGGMGGSHLQGDILKSVAPEVPLFFHNDYGLPKRNLKDVNLIASSYSGNTEEVVDFLNEGLRNNLRVGVIAKGGKLLQIAKEQELPYIELPESSVQPRMATGYSFLALVKFLGLKDIENNVSSLLSALSENNSFLEEEGKQISVLLKDKLPVIYSSQKNYATSLIWKINFNETTKIPAFYNLIPELNHNEMTGFDVTDSTKNLSNQMIFILLKDKEDDLRNQKRMSVLKEILEKKGLDVLEIDIDGATQLEKIFSNIILSAWTTCHLSDYYGTESSGSLLLVEEFKKMI